MNILDYELSRYNVYYKSTLRIVILIKVVKILIDS